MTMVKLSAVLMLTLTQPAFAQSDRQHGPTPEQKELMKQHNASVEHHTNNYGAEAERPFAEYEEAGYLIFSDSTRYESGEIKRKLAEELPDHMKLVVFTGGSTSSIQSIRNRYERYVGANRLIVLRTQSGGFWARDGVPIPVYEKDGRVRLVDAKYYHGWESDDVFANHFQTNIRKHSYYYEGGNFMVDAKGNCVIVNKSETSRIPNSIFQVEYGCRSVTRLDHLTGIGHADEVVKFLNDTTAVTDQTAYVPQLEALGYDVTVLPQPENRYETYANSLLIDNKLFVPIFGQSNDEKAIEAYENLGFDVYPLYSYKLSNYGHGSIHCITMTYPPMDIAELAQAFDAEIY